MDDIEPTEDTSPPEPPKITRKRVSGAMILDAIEDLKGTIASHVPGKDEEPEPEEDDSGSSLPPIVTFAPEPEPVPTPIATDSEATAPIPPVVTPGRRKGFPHRGRRGK